MRAPMRRCLRNWIRLCSARRRSSCGFIRRIGPLPEMKIRGISALKTDCYEDPAGASTPIWPMIAASRPGRSGRPSWAGLAGNGRGRRGRLTPSASAMPRWARWSMPWMWRGKRSPPWSKAGWPRMRPPGRPGSSEPNRGQMAPNHRKGCLWNARSFWNVVTSRRLYGPQAAGFLTRHPAPSAETLRAAHLVNAVRAADNVVVRKGARSLSS